jgi:hypothetical protein
VFGLTGVTGHETIMGKICTQGFGSETERNVQDLSIGGGVITKKDFQKEI